MSHAEVPRMTRPSLPSPRRLAGAVLLLAGACSSGSSPDQQLGLASQYDLANYDGHTLPASRAGSTDGVQVTGGTFRVLAGDTVQIRTVNQAPGSQVVTVNVGYYRARRGGATVTLTAIDDGTTRAVDVRAGGDSLLLHDGADSLLYARHP